MPLRYYFPLSAAFFFLVIAIARHFSMPVSPFVVILLFAETMLGFQCENHRVGNFLSGLFKGR